MLKIGNQPRKAYSNGPSLWSTWVYIWALSPHVDISSTVNSITITKSKIAFQIKQTNPKSSVFNINKHEVHYQCHPRRPDQQRPGLSGNSRKNTQEYVKLIRAAFVHLTDARTGRTLFGRQESACCTYEACVTDCQNGFGSNPIGEAACIESCASVAGTGGDACFCCLDGSQQPGSDGTSACANNGGGDDNTDDCTCPT